MSRISFTSAIFSGVVLISALVADADEGMWTLDNIPKKSIEQRYGFAMDDEWLEHAQLASLRMGKGGSGSFVSPDGLVLTNHHIVVDNLQDLSTSEKDYVKEGFYARTQEEEQPCPGFEIYQLRSYEDVTDRISKAIEKRGPDVDAYEAKRAAIAKLSKQESDESKLRCEVVELYQGGEYWLYRYKVHSDVRMVFAPESSAGYYGGDLDNFTFPRYCLDFAFVRVYEDGKPLKTEKWYSWSEKGAEEGELTFVTGHPGSTERARTVAQLTHERDFFLPFQEARMEKKVAVIKAYQERGAEETRRAHDIRFGTGNYLKRLNGLKSGLESEAVFSAKEAEEKKLRSSVEADEKLKSEYASAWGEIEASYEKSQERWKRDLFVLSDRYRGGQLASWAESLVRYSGEMAKPDDQRLEGFADADLTRTRKMLFAELPAYPDLEEVLLAHFLGELVEHLGEDDSLVKEALNGNSPKEVARKAAQETKVGDVEFRRKIAAMTLEELEKSSDPLIRLATVFDRHYRESHTWNQENVWMVELLGGTRIARAKFELYGKERYPDATSSLRLSFGKPLGYEQGTTLVACNTVLGGMYARHDSLKGEAPFDLSERVLDARAKVDFFTPLNFVSTHDITGGNSGSPVINRDHQIVGLIFCSNLQALSNDYIYSDEAARSISVHSAVIPETLRKIYGMEALADEITK